MCLASTEFILPHKFVYEENQISNIKKEKMKIMRETNLKFNVYLSHDEKLMLMKKTEKTGLIYYELIRLLFTDYEYKEKISREFYESLDYIKRTGNVLNQITTRMHYLGYAEDMNFLRKTVTNLKDIILSIKKYYLLPEKIDKDNV